MSVQNPFEPGSTLYWKREVRRSEEESADLLLKLQEANSALHAKHRAWEEADRRAESNRRKLKDAEQRAEQAEADAREAWTQATRTVDEVDEARQEAARLRAALQAISENSGALREGGADPMDLGDLEDALTDSVDRAVTALQSAPPASEPSTEALGREAYPQAYSPAPADRAPREGDNDGPVPTRRPSADRPEPSEALADFEAVVPILEKQIEGMNHFEAKATLHRRILSIRQALSHPAPASEPSEGLAFEQWWQEQVGDSDSWTTLERLAAKDAWDAALPQHAPAVPEYVRQRLWKIHSVLDRALGDTDCDWYETDDEMREEVPVQWAAKEIAHLAAAPTDGGEP